VPEARAAAAVRPAPLVPLGAVAQPAPLVRRGAVAPLARRGAAARPLPGEAPVPPEPVEAVELLEAPKPLRAEAGTLVDPLKAATAGRLEAGAPVEDAGRETEKCPTVRLAA
jgi:hypothetical protein